MASFLRIRSVAAGLLIASTLALVWSGADGEVTYAQTPARPALRAMLDAPLLFVKRHPYFAGHIYDDYYTWRPGGGIYVVENPGDPLEKHRVRAVIDPDTAETLGPGVYRDPELSWDARRVVFAFKGSANGTTSIYEIGVDGHALRRLTASDKYHDITPAYLPDGRIVFTSTRPRALVPCFNSGVDTLHVMEADGSNIRSISVNNVNEFDPAVLPDGRILYGRWEYVDKTALYMQSLWTMSPDGRMEEALFANNLARPTALLDARPVPGSPQVVAALTPHNGQAVGAIAMIDPRKGKNDLGAITNFTPEYATEMDQGLRVGPSDPWPLNEEAVLIANNAKGHGVIQLIDRYGNRELIHAEADISCYAPMLVKPRPRPVAISEPGETQPSSGRFLVVDVHQGLSGVPAGTVKRLRVVEETARTSGIPGGGRWWNQAFLVSWQGAYIVKNVLGTVPVMEDGSAYFEAPSGRALYFEALDEHGREVQRMRTFVQATGGATRSCVGCHEYKYSTPVADAMPLALREEPAQLTPESWGSGYIDYPTMVQPILDRHCVDCHGGEDDIAAGIDLSGGWTWAFNISYETLIKNCLVGFLNCNNGSVHTSVVLEPYKIGSGGAPLTDLLLSGHGDRIPNITPADRDLLMAWMDTNSNYYGTWDYTPHATCDAILQTRGPLVAAMRAAGCTQCHADGHIGSDWVNLQRPEWSRILRAPLTKQAGGLGLQMCRQREARSGYPLVDQRVQPPDFARPSIQPPWDPSGPVHIGLRNTGDPHYQQMLSIIRQARAAALAKPRIDMPGAEITAGECRCTLPPAVPVAAPALRPRLLVDHAVELAWQRTAATIGLQYELHRGQEPRFALNDSTQIALTTAGRFVDPTPPVGTQHYALVVTTGQQRSAPVWTSIAVPPLPPPQTPVGLVARALAGEIALSWEAVEGPGLRYDVYRTEVVTSQTARLNKEPLRSAVFVDGPLDTGKQYVYSVRAVDRRGQRSDPSVPVRASALPVIREPVFTAPFQGDARGRLLDGATVDGKTQGGATVIQDALDLRDGGSVMFDHRTEFDLRRGFSVTCWLHVDEPRQMPVVLSCGAWNGDGWFLQRYGSGWRWYLGGLVCDGGKPVRGRWIHLVATYDGAAARVFQDGKLAASADGTADLARWPGPLVVGQYAPSSGESYQVDGRIRDVRIYHRPIRAAEAEQLFRSGRQVIE